jgi:predicted nucleotidyltransferase
MVTPELIEAMVARIAGRVQPRQVILFDSQARGDTHPESDADFLVIVPSASDTRAVED